MSVLKKWLSPVFRRVVGATKHKFPFVYEKTGGLGEVFVPLVEAALWLPSLGSWLEFQFIVDTGATATILPSFIAEKLGIDLSSLPEVEMEGVEGSGIKSWLGEVKIKIDDWEFETRCFFVDNPRVPFLLGRADVLSREFSLLVSGKKGLVVLEEN